ncbi:MAG: hypothetical protein V1720_22730 [bacterium]
MPNLHEMIDICLESLKSNTNSPSLTRLDSTKRELLIYEQRPNSRRWDIKEITAGFKLLINEANNAESA